MNEYWSYIKENCSCFWRFYYGGAFYCYKKIFKDIPLTNKVQNNKYLLFLLSARKRGFYMCYNIVESGKVLKY